MSDAFVAYQRWSKDLEQAVPVWPQLPSNVRQAWEDAVGLALVAHPVSSGLDPLETVLPLEDDIEILDGE